jgi:hypothetical protein
MHVGAQPVFEPLLAELQSLISAASETRDRCQESDPNDHYGAGTRNAYLKGLNKAREIVFRARKAAHPPAAPVETDTKSAPKARASHNSGERLPSSDAAGPGADTHSSAGSANELADALEGLWSVGGRPDEALQAEVVKALRNAQPQSQSMEDVRQLAEIAIRTFCQSLGAGSVTISSDGVERIYHAGINLKALSVAVAMAVSRPHGGRE